MPLFGCRSWGRDMKDPSGASVWLPSGSVVASSPALLDDLALPVPAGVT